MRRFSYILAVLPVMFSFSSCEGPAGVDPEIPEEEVKVVLSADKPSIYADGADVVTFTVTADGTDVTGKAVIKVGGLAMGGNIYKTSAPGKYTFTAEYEGVTSNTVGVEAVKREQVESQFARHIVVWEFTGAWCTNCPSGYSNINYVVSRNDEYKETVHMMAFHSNYSGEDALALPDNMTDKIMNDEGVSAHGFPSFLTDLRTGGGLVTGTDFKNSLIESIEEYPAHCGVALTSEVKDGKAAVTVKLFSEMSAAYRIAVFVVEERVKYYQKDATLTHDEYNHRHVVRKIVSASYMGDRLGDVEAGKEVTKSYEINMDSDWNPEETYVYALAIDADGTVNNVNVCKVGGNSDYNRIK